VTGVAGYVAEPYLQGAVHPEILFPAYAAGLNLAEAFYLALPDLSWQSVIVGDPLCAPFPRPPVAAADIDPEADAATELPAWFGARRSDVLRSLFKNVPAGAVTLLVRAEGRGNRGDDAGARDALESAIRDNPDFAAAQLQLALLYEQARDYARAKDRYAEVVRVEPNNAVALNNLAYNLAVHQNNLAEALPFARRAWAVTPNNVNIVDTLAWIHHLQGNSSEAARLLRTMVQRDTGLAEVHLHAAIVFAAVGDLRESERQLVLAVTRDPALEDTSSVRDLRERLKKG
jgi:tetratricopeptide (TPR) repeat protein